VIYKGQFWKDNTPTAKKWRFGQKFYASGAMGERGGRHGKAKFFQKNLRFGLKF
jgi:hypothetical protein